jgi:hypothetical protein
MPSRDLDNLSYAADLVTGNVLWNFSKVNELATPLSRPSLQYKVPGTNVPYDPLGLDPNWIDLTTLRVKFYHAYVGNETFFSVKDNLWLKLGNRAVMLYVVQSDGTIKRNIGKLTQRPMDETTVQKLDWCEFDITFQMASPFWKSVPPATALFYDNNQKYDVGLAYEQGGQTVILTNGAGPWNLTVTNNGNAPDYEPRFIIPGPVHTQISIINLGIQYPAGPMIMQYFGTNLASGEMLVIDVGLAQVVRNGNLFQPDRLTWGIPGSGQREWFRIDPGPQVIQIQNADNVAGGSLTCLSLDTSVL